MGCLSLKTNRIGALSVAFTFAPFLSATTYRADAMSMTARRADDFGVNVERKDGLNVSASLICTASDAYYLYVTPTETQWVTEWDSAVYDVTSNTMWTAN